MPQRYLLKLFLGDTSDSEPLYGHELDSIKSFDGYLNVGQPLFPRPLKGDPTEFIIEDIKLSSPDELIFYDATIYLRQKMPSREGDMSVIMATGVRGSYVDNSEELTLMEKMAIFGI